MSDNTIMIYSNGNDEKFEEKPIEKFPSIIHLNVGGHTFTTRLSTLRRYSDSMLATMFSGRHHIDKDEKENYFIDNNGTYFCHVLDYLRNETLPPRDVMVAVYKEAGYYGISQLQEALSMSPEVARLIVREKHQAQFPSYHAFRQQVVQLAMNNAVASRLGEVVLFVRRCVTKNIHNSCISETAQLKIGPWDAPVDEEVFMRTLATDLEDAGYRLRQHEKKRCKWLVQGASCQCFVFRLVIDFT